MSANQMNSTLRASEIIKLSFIHNVNQKSVSTIAGFAVDKARYIELFIKFMIHGRCSTSHTIPVLIKQIHIEHSPNYLMKSD